MLVALWLTLDSLILVDGDHFPRGHEVYLLFNYDIVNYLLNTTEGKNRRPNFVISVVWSALIACGWVLVSWSRLEGKLKWHLLCLCTFFNDGGRRESSRFHLFAPDDN